MTLLFAWLLADFVAGIAHWVQDRFVHRGPFYEANELHHLKPAALCRLSYWENINSTLLVTLPLAALLALVGAPAVVTLAALLASFANLVHRWSHDVPSRVPRLARAAQRVGLFSSREQHLRHHFGDKKILSRADAFECWCPLTDWLNPLLDRVGFFRGLDLIFGKRK